MIQPDFINEEVDYSRLPSFETVTYQKLASDYLWVSYLRAIIWYGGVFFFYFIMAFGLREQVPLYWRQVIPILLAVWVLFGLFRVYMVVKKKGYALRTQDVHFKSGWLWTTKTTIPYHRIQHCELSSGPMEKIFDLSTVHIYTAGGSQSDLTIPGLTMERGLQIKQFILDKIGDEEE
jgi:membrane protein YdbS with pleckstrin-like domain